MKSFLPNAVLLLVCSSAAFSQQVIIKGTIRCVNTDVNSSRGATNIVIVPSFNPAASVATTTTPQGFFQINTGWNAGELKDKTVSLYIITKCKTCKPVERIFVSEDLDKKNTDPNKIFVTVKGWKILQNCREAELADLLSAKMLDSARRLPAETVDGRAPGSPALMPVSFLNLFSKLLNVAAAGGNFGLFQALTIFPGKIKYGNFLFSSPMINTDNTGFNFAGSRNLSEAVFWNAAAIAQTAKPYHISFLSNFKNNIKLSGFQKITNNFYLGVGGIYTEQDEFRNILFAKTSNANNNIPLFHKEKLREFAVFAAPVYKINNRMAAGITVKSVWQQFNNPYLADIQKDDNNTLYNFFQDDSVRRQHIDADFSFNYKITRFLQAGISVMNVAGTKLYADMFVKAAEKKFVQQRSYGAGLCYKNKRFNAGADVLVTDNKFYDASIGINYVPFNDGLLAAGFTFKQKSFSVAAQLKHFKIAFINDNNLVINDTKKPGSNIFNGKIYTGFVFNF